MAAVDAATAAENCYTPGNVEHEVRKQDAQSIRKRPQKACQVLRSNNRNKSDVWCSL